MHMCSATNGYKCIQTQAGRYCSYCCVWFSFNTLWLSVLIFIRRMIHSSVGLESSAIRWSYETDQKQQLGQCQAAHLYLLGMSVHSVTAGECGEGRGRVAVKKCVFVCVTVCVGGLSGDTRSARLTQTHYIIPSPTNKPGRKFACDIS